MKPLRLRAYVTATQDLLNAGNQNPSHWDIAKQYSDSDFPPPHIVQSILDGLSQIRDELREKHGYPELHTVSIRFYNDFARRREQGKICPTLPETIEQAFRCVPGGRSPAVGLRMPEVGSQDDLIYRASLIRTRSVGKGIVNSVDARAANAAKTGSLTVGTILQITGQSQAPQQ